MTTLERTTTVRTMVMMARMTGKVDNDGMDDDSKDGGDNGKDDRQGR
jgi:hypothetical protein